METKDKISDVQSRVVLPTKEILNAVSFISDSLVDETDTIIDPNLVILRRLNAPFNCLTLDISKIPKIVQKGAIVLVFRFTRSESSVQILVEDKLRLLDRDNPDC